MVIKGQNHVFHTDTRKKKAAAQSRALEIKSRYWIFVKFESSFELHLFLDIFPYKTQCWFIINYDHNQFLHILTALKEQLIVENILYR